MSKVPAVRLTTTLVLLFLIAATLPASAELEDVGYRGEYFLDNESGLYWFDPCHFHDQARATLDIFSDHSQVWSWATSAEVDALLDQMTAGGEHLEDVMGLRRSTLGGGGPRWLGYYFDSGDDGWIVQSDETPWYVTVTATSPQANATALGAGAWFVARVNPEGETAVLEDDGMYFHDQSTNLYWYDPAEFFSFTRPDVEGWLTANTDWRWATEAEVFGLLGKCTINGNPMEEVMGTRSSTLASGGPRWVGYYIMDGIVNGLLLQADIAPDFYIIVTGSTQANAGAFNPGAWLVSDIDPTPNENASWGDVKQSYK